jgi:transposase
VDCAKARSKIMLTDFYGRVLIEPTTVTRDRFGLDAAATSVRDAAARHVLKDLIVLPGTRATRSTIAMAV